MEERLPICSADWRETVIASVKCEEPSLNSRALCKTCCLKCTWLFARANHSGQASVVNAVITVPQWLAQLNSLAKYLNFL